MNRIDLLLNVLDTTFDKESWYAPLKHAIDGINAEQASWRPAGQSATTIWETVNHLIYYKERLVANIEGRQWTRIDGNETFYITEQSNDDNEWKKVVDRLETIHNSLRHLLSKMSDEDLDQNSFESNLLDIMLHDAYHTGQIIQIRKMQGSWPSHR
ncbi:DinB family protein [Bacillus sp. EAC]|uniref:DinB family protein n=1 Tax=Bacillus sp. EAC TaxID=1978338 RepID=UPI000B446ADF|nr:DinB family protein [Bacillus sp. EAC]